MRFVELTQANGQPLDIPDLSLLLVEELDPETKEQHPDGKCGIFYDLGNGLQSMVVQEPYGKLQKLLDQRFVETVSGIGNKMAVLKENVVSLRGLADEGDSKTLLTHRLGQQLLNIHIRDTRDQVREKLNG